MNKTNDEYINEASTASQCNRILAYLKEGNSLTQMEALPMFGCSRLASRINDLKNRGESIESIRIVLPNGKRVAQYRMAV